MQDFIVGLDRVLAEAGIEWRAGKSRPTLLE
jgi:hypothetical protein